MARELAITVDVEEWYHSRWFNVTEVARQEDSCKTCCRENVAALLGMFSEMDISATFFTLGEIAEKHPLLMEDIVSNGHEIACHGYTHETVETLGPVEFRRQLEKSIDILSKVAGSRPVGYRAPHFEMNAQGIGILEDLGFIYDSSVVPCWLIPGWYGYPRAPITPYRPSRQDLQKPTLNRCFVEIPIGVLPYLKLPGAGGWYLRNVGSWWTKAIVRALLRRGPAVIYVHPWEVVDVNPRPRGIPLHVFRRTGSYVAQAIRGIARLPNVELITLKELAKTYI